MKKVFTYLDYREFLGDWLASRKSADPSFSYQRFADLCGFRAKDFIYRVIKGQKNLSKPSGEAIARALRLSKRDAEYFLCLVDFNQGKEYENREKVYLRLQKLAQETSPKEERVLITHDQYALFSEWHHLVIRSLIGQYPFKDNYKELASRVYPSISEAQARKSVELLERLGFIERDHTGYYRITSQAITTGENVKRFALQHYYMDTMRLAGEAMDKLPREKRNITGVTLGISQETYDVIVEKIQNFRRELAELADADMQADRVVQVNFQVFPVSDPDSERTENE